jgi:hypothetical protein
MLMETAEILAERQQTKPKRRAPPHAFKPGQSGNPKGRTPKTEIERRQEAIYKVARDIAVTNIAEALRGGVPEACNALIQIAADERQDASDRIAAATALMDRVYGKPVQSSQIAVADVTPVDRQALQDRIARISTALRGVVHEPSIFD